MGCLTVLARSAVCVLTLDTEPLIPPASDQRKREGDSERVRERESKLEQGSRQLLERSGEHSFLSPCYTLHKYSAQPQRRTTFSSGALPVISSALLLAKWVTLLMDTVY